MYKTNSKSGTAIIAVITASFTIDRDWYKVLNSMILTMVNMKSLRFDWNMLSFSCETIVSTGYWTDLTDLWHCWK